MKTNTRIPLAIALSSALAFAVGCTADRDRNDQAGVLPADERAAEVTPATDPAMQGDATYGDAGATYGDAAQDPAWNDPQRTDMGDGRDSNQPVNDTWITTKVKSSLLADSDVSGLDIEVETVNGVVTLSGQVDQQSQIDEATRIARDIEGVTDVRTASLTVGTDAN